jgi:hypothetical protein
VALGVGCSATSRLRRRAVRRDKSAVSGYCGVKGTPSSSYNRITDEPDEILAAIPTLSFAERQQLVRRAIAVEDDELSVEESAILEERVRDFRENPDLGIGAESLKASVMQRLKPQ